MKRFYSPFFILCSFQFSAQVILNAYAKVTAITGGNVLSVNNYNTTNHSFNAGEKVIIMQMQDDVLGSNNGNNNNFGNLSNISKAGTYEIGVISSVTPNALNPSVITLSAPLNNTYNTGSNSSLQIITFRNLGTNYTTTANVTALSWNGNIGGVIAIEVNNVLTVNHNITADQLGFRGGAISTSAGGGCQPSLYTTNSTSQAYKGEGIYKSTNSTYSNGRSKILNGGGGGNEHNGGGAGGGNYSVGGDGGGGWGCAVASGGIGGLALQANINNQRFFMGGGGGGGQQNNNVASPGANGGGIVIVKAGAIVTGTNCTTPYRISANGGNGANSGNDGGGGGGAGGSVFLDVTTFSLNATCPLNITANGGNGGNVTNSGVHGGGGGGGQGVLIFNNSFPSTNANVTTTYGNGGSNSTPASSYAQSGGGPSNAGIFAPTLLPMELLSFDAVKNGDRVEIFWTTASEYNNDYFVLERSKDGVDFDKLAIIDGAGTTHNIIQYAETDFHPYKGVSYYRLKQTDFDNKSTYSNVVTVNYTLSTKKLDVFPNPSGGDGIKMNFENMENTEVLVVLRDINGKEFYSKVLVVLENAEIIGIDTENRLTPGTYIITATSNNLLYSKKLIVK